MPKFFSVLFLVLFSFSTFAQSSLIDYGPAEISGTSIVDASLAPVVFLDQVPNGVNGFFADSSFNGTNQQSIADNFAVAVAGPTYGITEIVFWGGYFPENIPNPTDDFTIILHSDAGGSPGPVIYARYDLQGSRATTGVVLFGVDEYVFTFDFSASPMIIASTGTYWIEIYNNSTASSAFFWETGNLDVTHGVAGNNFAVETPGVTWLGNTGNDQAIQINGDNAVPVELVSFEATTNGTNVNLNWATASETNNQGFSIERSSGAEFKAIGYVSGFGTTTENKYYTFTDREVTSGIYTYRLKQIDFDGTFEYSNVVEVEILTPAEFNLAQNYPNPFNPSTKITFRLAADSKVSLKVFDVLGQEVMALINNELTAGSHQVDFDASSLNSGVYFYKIEAAGNNGTNFNDVKKMILTK
ncbi:MAG TPA: T9SS type A sorting domain-containing protein [Ignavibacteriaceae bacterium]|nr:T9SS type A sorting domain-containing protein [Ignavibacteriaceae bacterium]